METWASGAMEKFVGVKILQKGSVPSALVPQNLLQGDPNYDTQARDNHLVPTRALSSSAGWGFGTSLGLERDYRETSQACVKHCKTVAGPDRGAAAQLHLFLRHVWGFRGHTWGRCWWCASPHRHFAVLAGCLQPLSQKFQQTEVPSLAW